MDEQTIQRLNAINREFYITIVDDFDATRRNSWQGWERLLHLLHTPLTVLDVGCGNGRFGVFLAERLGGQIHYHGVDNNPALLDRARQSLTTIEAQFEERDVVEMPPDDGKYDLVALFGVLHHIPGEQQRLNLIKSLAERLAPNGLLVFTCWRFYEFSRFRERIVPMPAGLSAEPGDYLLEWRRGEKALRYCHYADDTEVERLIAASMLSSVVQYRADGYGGDMNLYVVLKAD
jgi:SAM-dependent methyltransferase